VARVVGQPDEAALSDGDEPGACLGDVDQRGARRVGHFQHRLLQHIQHCLPEGRRRHRRQRKDPDRGRELHASHVGP